MDHKQLLAFLTISDAGTMTRAAQLLNVVQPALSRQLQLLEQDVGLVLFERSRKGMVLTRAGKILQGYARRVMLEVARARAELQSSATEISGIVNVGLLPSTIEALPTPLIDAVTQAYPKVRLSLSMGYYDALRQGLERGEIDVAVLYGIDNDPLMQAVPLLTEPVWLVGLPSSRLRKSRPVPVTELAGKPMILAGRPQSVRTLLDRACARAGVQVSIAVETNAMSVMKELVLGGHGYTLLPPISFARELAAKTLAGAPIDAEGFFRTLVLAMASNRPPAPHVRAVTRLLVDVMRSAVESGRWPQARWIAEP